MTPSFKRLLLKLKVTHTVIYRRANATDGSQLEMTGTVAVFSYGRTGTLDTFSKQGTRT